MKVRLLGTGTCRLSTRRATSSAFLRKYDHLLLVDCGHSVPAKVAEFDLLRDCTSLDIFISHRHSDHFIGLFPLLQALTWSDDVQALSIRNIRLHCTQEVATLYRTVAEAIGFEEYHLSPPEIEPRRLEVLAGPDDGDWLFEFAGKSIHAVHLPGHHNHGLRFEEENNSCLLCCDASELSSQLLREARSADVCVFDFGHLCYQFESGLYRYDPEAVVTLLAAAQDGVFYASHCYLRDKQQMMLSEKDRETIFQTRIEEIGRAAAERGFTGSLAAAHDGMELLPT